MTRTATPRYPLPHSITRATFTAPLPRVERTRLGWFMNTSHDRSGMGPVHLKSPHWGLPRSSFAWAGISCLSRTFSGDLRSKWARPQLSAERVTGCTRHLAVDFNHFHSRLNVPHAHHTDGAGIENQCLFLYSDGGND